MLNNKMKFLLYLQMVLAVCGLLIQTGIFIFVVANNLSVYMIISSLVLILAHLAVMFYGIIGYKKGKVSHLISIFLFLLAILVNIIIPFRDVTQKILLVLLFGLMSIFPFKQDDYKFTNYLILIASIVSLGFSIYSSITANFNALGNVKYKELATVLMYLSIFAPVMFTGLFGVSYNYKHNKEK